MLVIVFYSCDTCTSTHLTIVIYEYVGSMLGVRIFLNKTFKHSKCGYWVVDKLRPVCAA